MKALIRVTGAVQGIGYRPFVAGLATEYKLKGSVRNLGGIVEINAEGDKETILSFADRLRSDCPPGGFISDVLVKELNDNGKPEGQYDRSGFHVVEDFVIVESADDLEKNGLPVFPPDIGICDKCTAELLDKGDRRYEYPLISCASCGPRFSILKSLPYDRDTTTMEEFKMCPKCEVEYKKGRRRHAQTISCHDCGPQAKFVFRGKEKSAGANVLNDKDNFENDNIISGNDAIKAALDILKNDGIIGLKGVGGYQLLVRPGNYEAVQRLRDIKGREKKPFAVMFYDAGTIAEKCMVSDIEKEYLESSARPIVLLDKKTKNDGYAENVCGESAQIGAFLPSTGIHILLMKEIKELIVTSANISGDPMIISDAEFDLKFGDKVDGILFYDREILRPLDDSVLQIVHLDDGKDIPRFIRRARGYVPLPLFVKKGLDKDTEYYAFGADLKNTVSIGYGDKIIMSQFLGDMENLMVQNIQEREMKGLCDIFGSFIDSTRVIYVSDLHPGYYSTKITKKYFGLQKNKLRDKASLTKIQHHHAHIGSVMAEHGLTDCIGVSFDGTGYGTNGAIWGSEFLLCNKGSFERAGHFSEVKMVGSDNLAKDARLQATCFLVASGMDSLIGILPESEEMLVRAALLNNINVHENCGMGRIFDAVSCILGFCDYNGYEGECAVKLQRGAEEYIKECIEKGESPSSLTIDFTVDDEGVIDSSGLIKSIYELRDLHGSGELSYAFHKALSRSVLEICKKIREKSGENKVCLSGGVFTNRLLFKETCRILEESDFMVYYNMVYPTNDGGISAGQIYLADLVSKD